MPLDHDLDVGGARHFRPLGLGGLGGVERQGGLQTGDDAVGGGVVPLHEDGHAPRRIAPADEGAASDRAAGGPGLRVGVAGLAVHPLAGHWRRQGVGHDDRHVLLQDPGRHRRRRPAGHGELGTTVVFGQLLGLRRVAAVVAGPDHHLAAPDAALGVEEPQRQDQAELERAAAAGGGPREIADRADLPGRSPGSGARGHPQRHRRQRRTAPDLE